MKKLLSLLLAVLIPVFSMTACSTEAPPFEILEIGGYHYRSGANHSDDIRLKTSRIKERNPIPNKKIECNGTQYELPYNETRIGYTYHDSSDGYRMQTANKLVEIEINRDTGRIDFYSWFDKDHFNAATSDELSREECLAAAREYLGTYIEDNMAYDLINERYSTSDFGHYIFYFMRKVEGVETCDWAAIGITTQGIIYIHSFFSLGEMRDAVLPPQETMDAIRAGLDERLDEIYAPVKDKYTVSYELNKEEFIRLADGSYALDYYFDIHGAPKNSEQSPWVEGTHLLVRLN
ncbi:MAG: hypothetical protein J6Q53_04685 [Oscillospiraceae bacterium]|nr:hypothetical protein [Oscillospiraceae bacterium]